MQQIGEIAENHTYKNKKGEEQHLEINAIPNNMEKYVAFMLSNHLNFIDNFQFMSSSLDKLVSNLPKESFKYTSEEFTVHMITWIVLKNSIKRNYQLAS